MAWPECPVCGRVDEVQLASAAVAAGRAWVEPRGLALRLQDPTCTKWDAADKALGSYRWGWLYGAVAVAVLIGGALLVQQPLIGILVMVVTILIGLVIAGRRTWKTRAVIKYNRDVAAWNRSVAAKWQNLCYCHRCDQVFSPGSSSAMSPEEWRQSLGTSPSDLLANKDLAGIVEAAIEHPRGSSSRPGST